MEAFNECNICNEPFQFEIISRQAICLPCGHSACRSCLTRIHTAHCPTCRAPFAANVAAMAPNYDLHEILAATSSSSGSALEIMASHIAVISAQVAVLQLDNTRRDVAATASQKELHEMHVLLHRVCGQLHLQPYMQPAAQQPYQTPQRVTHHTAPPSSSQAPGSAVWMHSQVELQQEQQQQQQQQNQHPQQQQQQLRQSQQQARPLVQQNSSLQQTVQQAEQQRPVIPPPPPPPCLPPSATPTYAAAAQLTHTSHTPASALQPATNGNTSAGPSYTSPSQNVVLEAHSDSLLELFKRIRMCTVPTTFDLCGRTMRHLDGDLPARTVVIHGSNITIRNGTIQQPESKDKNSPSLHIQGTNVNLEGLVFKGGGHAVLVLPGGSAEITSCAVFGPFIGLGVGDFALKGIYAPSRLEARDVKVSGCIKHGLAVGRGAEANLRRCKFMNALNHGIFVIGNSSSKLVASEVRCGGNKKRGLSVVTGATALLSKCNLTGNAGGGLFVQDSGSLVKHLQCALGDDVVVNSYAVLEEVQSL